MEGKNGDRREEEMDERHKGMEGKNGDRRKKWVEGMKREERFRG